MSERTTESTSHWKLISFLLAGILIPLVAASLPWVLENLFPRASLSYSIQGPITSENTAAFEIRIKNDGRSTEENIEVWVPLQLISSLVRESQKDGTVRLVDQEPRVIFESSVPAQAIEMHEGRRVLKFTSLRPGETITISGFAYGGRVLLSKYDLERLRVVSTGAVGVNDTPSDLLFLLYRTGAWVLVALVLAGFAYSIYYEYFMPLAKKEKYLLEQIDKLEKKK